MCQVPWEYGFISHGFSWFIINLSASLHSSEYPIVLLVLQFLTRLNIPLQRHRQWSEVLCGSESSAYNFKQLSLELQLSFVGDCSWSWEVKSCLVLALLWCEFSTNLTPYSSYYYACQTSIIRTKLAYLYRSKPLNIDKSRLGMYLLFNQQKLQPKIMP